MYEINNLLKLKCPILLVGFTTQPMSNFHVFFKYNIDFYKNISTVLYLIKNFEIGH